METARGCAVESSEWFDRVDGACRAPTSQSVRTREGGPRGKSRANLGCRTRLGVVDGEDLLHARVLVHARLFLRGRPCVVPCSLLDGLGRLWPVPSRLDRPQTLALAVLAGEAAQLVLCLAVDLAEARLYALCLCVGGRGGAAGQGRDGRALGEDEVGAEGLLEALTLAETSLRGALVCEELVADGRAACGVDLEQGRVLLSLVVEAGG